MTYNNLCSCLTNDLTVCVLGCCFPSCMNTATAYKLSTGKNINCCSFICSPQILTPYYNRKQINQRFGIHNSDCSDCLVSICCIPCAIIQNENNFRQLSKNIHVQ